MAIVENMNADQAEKLQDMLNGMKQDNPDLNFKIMEMDDRFRELVAEQEKNTTHNMVCELLERIGQLERKIDLIFGGYVLMEGVDGNMHWVKP